MKANLDEEIYKSVPAEQREELSKFRTEHPYKQLTADRVQWEYIASGEGPEAVLILGGAIAMGETAFKTILRLENRFRVLSPSYPSEWKMSAIAEGLAAILEAEGVSQAHVFGHSFGAAAGHAFVRLCPERVDKLVLDGFGLYTPGHVRFAKLFFKLPFGLLIAYYRRTINRLMAGADDPEILFWKAYMEELLTRLHTRETLMAN